MPEPQSVKIEATPSPAENTTKKKFKLGLVAVSGLVLLGAGLYFLSREDNDSATKSGAGSKVEAVLHLETFVLNLADPEAKSYLRVGIDLGLARPLAKEEPSPVALVRDTILGVLARATAEEVEAPDGKDKLKRLLLEALRQRAPELEVEEVYFTEFLVQR